MKNLSILFIIAILASANLLFAQHDHMDLVSFIPTASSEVEPSTEENNAAYIPVTSTKASFLSGKMTLAQFINAHLAYPKQAKEYGIEGKVFIQVTVDQEGKIQQPKIVKGLGYGCDEAVLNLVAKMPNWNPARQGNRPVTSKVLISFVFILNADSFSGAGNY